MIAAQSPTLESIRIVRYRCRDIGYGVESGTIRGKWGERDYTGKREIASIGYMQTLYLFDDEIVSDRPAPRSIELQHNGDPYGGGFTGSELTDRGYIYRGDIGARPRSWWRTYCARNGYKLREAS